MEAVMYSKVKDVQLGRVRPGIAWRVAAWWGAARCGVARCGVARCSVARCGVAFSGEYLIVR